MKIISTQFNSFVSKANIMSNDIERFSLRFILGYFAVLAFIYVFFLGGMIFNIVERKSLEADARSLSNEVRDLELSYLSLSNNIDLNFSHSLGFREIKTNFATRKSLGYADAMDNDL